MLSHKLGLEVIAEKQESQDICFVPDGDHTKIIRKKLGSDTPALSRGPFVLSNGHVIGEHDGYARFTIGQRRGVPGGFREPMFVVAIRPHDRAVVIGQREELLGLGLVAREINWLVDAPAIGAPVSVQIRHRAAPAAATLIRQDADEIELALDEPVAANPNFANASIRVEGTYNGTPFVFTSSMTDVIEMSFSPPVVIDADNQNVTIDVDLSSWFKVNGQVIDPTTANPGQPNENAVRNNIRASLRGFEDDDRNGHDEADDHH